jgi:hypothetical protein
MVKTSPIRPTLLLAILLTVLFASPARAQNGSTIPAQAFGPGIQVTWMPATLYGGVSSAGLTLVHASSGWFAPPTFGVFAAALPLPSGAHLESFWCQVNDSNPTNNIQIALSKYTLNTLNGTDLGGYTYTANTTGSAGFATIGIILQPQDGLILYEQGTDHSTFQLSVTMFATGGGSHLFRGCALIWRRTVSPAPAAATFADVPVGDPLHRFVEAMVAAGITGGCGGNNYCPNAPITRGQMAVFLAAALGLHWPN